MARVILTNLILFLLPFVIYAVYVKATAAERKSASDIWADMPVLALLAAGMLLVFIAVVSFASFTGGSPTGHYRPPEYKDGEIRPGVIE